MNYSRVKSVANNQYTGYRKLQPLACIKSFEKSLHFRKVIRTAVIIANCNNQIVNVLHNADLKQVFEKLEVGNASSSLQLNDYFVPGVVAIGFEDFSTLPPMLVSPSRIAF